MQSQTSDNSGFNKLKAILSLIFSCNHTTIFGCIVVWVFIQHNNLIEGWFEALRYTLCMMPFFMGDAVSNYVLGRIRLESINNWDDISLATKTKDRVASNYKLYRVFSIVSAFGLAAFNLFNLLRKPIPLWFTITIIAFAITHFSLCLNTIYSGIIPLTSRSKKSGIFSRLMVIAGISALWWWLFSLQDFKRTNLLFIFMSGLSYFFICGLMHPLPTHTSLISSILRDMIIASNKMEEEKDEHEHILSYNQKSKDIEDASIVEEIKNVSRETNETMNQNQNTPTAEAVLPDAIILTNKEESDE